MPTVRITSIALALAFATACGGTAPTPATSPQARAVEVGKSDPPAGATELGVIEVEHGDGCGMYGTKGTLEGAIALLKEEAVRRGANYVELLTLTEPHAEHGCYVQAYKARGMAYRLTGDSASPPAPSKATCDPPCSPGYKCSHAKCVAQCNPPCEAPETCQADRTCSE